jgi:hypothetical protein
VPITRQKSPVFSIVSLPTDSVIVDHAVGKCIIKNVACMIINQTIFILNIFFIIFQIKKLFDTFVPLGINTMQ